MEKEGALPQIDIEIIYGLDNIYGKNRLIASKF